MRSMLSSLFVGRNGMDQLNTAVISIGALSWVIALLVPGAGLKKLLRYVFVLAAGLCFYRAWSRNLDQRYAENQKFLAKTSELRGSRESWQNKAEQRREYKVFKCPSCGVKLRVPRGKGKILVNCRQCGASFEEKS